ncbi:DUF2141 domain-containing protein [Maribacter halichondriae]|uniref:DUF2141 domain-containing protein n=1 Tax=Maribacter halichondriae TaxID=2980554 RepID=UPI00235A3EE3|nr:DUF2141 domain-containing protein [Maribacter sp. Hal144]
MSRTKSEIAMKKVFALLLWVTPLWAMSQNKLTVSVVGVPASIGNVSAGVYNSEVGFLKIDHVIAGKFVQAVRGTTRIELDNLPNGTYAVAIFYDENGNEKLDTNFLGIPKEKVAFSNAKMKTFGPPGFDECSFKVIGDQEMKISF